MDNSWEIRRDELIGWIDGLRQLPDRTQVFYCIEGTIATGEALLAASLDVLRISHEAGQKRSLEAILIFSLDAKRRAAVQSSTNLDNLAKYLLDYGSFGRPDIMIREPNGPWFALPDEAIVEKRELATGDPNLRSVLRMYRHRPLYDTEVLEPIIFIHQASVTL